MLFSGWLALAGLPVGAAPTVGTVTVRVTPQPVATFDPGLAFGAGVDGLERGDVAKVYTPANLRAMSGVGFGPLTYRLRTELGVEAWHWNPQGRWTGRGEGYWIGGAASKTSLTLGYGFRLPRRGSTEDQANNDGYSRLDDGDPHTFWKSNPYLDRHFTGEDNAGHPQWIVVDLGEPQPVDTLSVQWAAPYATRYRVEYWVGRDSPNDGLDQTYGKGTRWVPFPGGVVTHGRGGPVRLRLCAVPVAARFVRLWMTASSDTAAPEATDVRDRLGYAIREVAVGVTDARGRLHDGVRHAARHDGQSEIYASSTDPWHRASDRDTKLEQPGFDRVFRSPLTHGQPVLAPTSLLYGTPQDSVAEVRWLKARGYPLRGVEMGEEPDGQYMTPEDYGALYVQWADALHREDPGLKLGGPCFQTNIAAWVTWPDAAGSRSWMGRFLAYLKRRGHSRDFNFFSFEWYPFDNVCAPPTPQLLKEPRLLAHTLERLQKEGLPRTIPWLMTEYGYSAFAGQAEMDLPGGLLNAEIAAQFLTLGGATAYLYGLEPNTPIQEVSDCPTFGNLAVFLSDDDRHIRQPLPTFYAQQMLTKDWAQASGRHALYAASSDVRDKRGQDWVTAYAVHRPDGQWAVLLINKDPQEGHPVRLDFGAAGTLAGPASVVQYGPAQYMWQPQGEDGHPTRDLPPTRTTVPGGAAAVFPLPPYSLTVVRGRL